MSYFKNFVGTEQKVRIIHGKRAIRVRAIEVILYASEYLCDASDRPWTNQRKTKQSIMSFPMMWWQCRTGRTKHIDNVKPKYCSEQTQCTAKCIQHKKHGLPLVRPVVKRTNTYRCGGVKSLLVGLNGVYLWLRCVSGNKFYSVSDYMCFTVMLHRRRRGPLCGPNIYLLFGIASDLRRVKLYHNESTALERSVIN